ncbi:MAG: DMT family transporter [Thermoplasmata archaeon]
MNSKEIGGIGVLLIVTFIWGVTFPVIKEVFLFLSPTVFLSFRFIIAVIVMIPFVFMQFRGLNRTRIKYGIIAGIFLFIAYYLQTVGLKYTEPALSGIITGIYVVFIPIISYFYVKRKIMRVEVFSSVFAFAGLVLMSYTSITNISIQIGNIMTFIAALFYSFQLVYVSKHAKEIDPIMFSFIQIVMVAIFSTAMIPVDSVPMILNGYSIFVIIFTAVFATFIAMYIYVKALSWMNVTKVGVILIGEPIFAILTSVYLYGEKLSILTVLGMFIMIISMVVISYYTE